MSIWKLLRPESSRSPLRKLLATVSGSLSLFLVLATSASAGPITYRFVDNLGGTDPNGSFTGTITTDGTLGSLSLSNLIEWNCVATNYNPGYGDLIVNGAIIYLPNSFLSGDFEATSDQLYLVPPAPASQSNTFTETLLKIDDARLFPNQLLFTFSSSYGENGVSFRHEMSTQSAVGYYDAQQSAIPTNWVIATAVPEPSSIVLFSMSGVVLLAFIYRRRLQIIAHWVT